MEIIVLLYNLHNMMQLSKVVTETLLADDEIETQSLIISYFIKSAEVSHHSPTPSY